MKSSLFLPHRRSSLGGSAFTLIELLVVISIIAVLAGLLLPVVNKVTENARKVSAKSTETQVVSSINNYQVDYGQYPVVVAADSTTKDAVLFPSVGHNCTVLNALRAIKTGDTDQDALNSRQIVYFEGKNVKNAALPKDGFFVTGTGKSTTGSVTFMTGDLIDPWGNSYMLRIDTNYNNVVTNPYVNDDGSSDNPTATGTAAADILRVGAVCYSYGADGVPGSTGAKPTSPYATIGDDVVSWQ